jgi:glycogen(starch) synthase
MKVLLVADAVGGVFTYAVELSRALAARGVAVVLATEGARLAADQRRALESIPGLVHEESAFRLEWMDEPWEDVRLAGGWLLALEARERPDVVHLDSYAHGALPFRAPKLVVGHSCVLSWYEAVRGTAAPASWTRYRLAAGAGLRAADAIAAPSAWMAAELVRHQGPIAPPVVIPNGRDPARFRPGAKEELVLAAGRLWDEAKNAAAVVRVAPSLPWQVWVAGEWSAPDAAGVPPAAAAASLLGRLPEEALASWYARAAIFAHPARYEPFGLAVLEAALSGCALVLGDIPSLRETWDGAAEFVSPRSDDELAEAIRALAAQPARRRTLGEAARQRALAFTPARMAEGYLALYRSMLGRRVEAGANASP